MDELARLELVNKVVSRLEEEVGIGDRTLAEFVIHLAQEAGTPVAFTESLAKNGADFSDDLSRQIFALVEEASTPLPAARIAKVLWIVSQPSSRRFCAAVPVGAAHTTQLGRCVSAAAIMRFVT